MPIASQYRSIYEFLTFVLRKLKIMTYLRVRLNKIDDAGVFSSTTNNNNIVGILLEYHVHIVLSANLFKVYFVLHALSTNRFSSFYVLSWA